MAVAGRQKSNRRHAATKNGYTLPLVVDPPETLCVCVPVPDDQFHRAAFLGQLYALGRAFTWGNDAEHTALTAAEVWFNIFINVRDQMALQPRHCGCPDGDKIYRIDESGNLESSTDGGATWELDPGDDPRLNAPLFPPLPGADGDEKRCLAANHATAQIKQSCDQLIADAALWSAITYLIAAIQAILVFLSIFATGGVLTPLVVTAAGALLSFGQAAFASAMTEEVYETLHCIIYCAMSDAGVVDEAGWQVIKSEITLQLTGIAATHLYNVVNIMGANGLTNAGRTEGIPMDLPCDDCNCDGWCYEFNFASSDGDWLSLYGSYGGGGWTGTPAGTGSSIVIYKSGLPDFNINYMEIDVEYEPQGNIAVIIDDAVGTFTNIGATTGTYNWSGDVSGTKITLNPSSGESQGAYVKMTRILFKGAGANPFGEDNC